MSDAIFPLVFANDEFRLLTAIAIGFLFGFSLERAGFGNARKLAAQFYLTDMTVFKVMFTAILVAMVGLYTLAELGFVDLARMWINPTFVWSQVVGGFLLGVGFIMSGLCPGTSVVSAASGRWDGVVTLAGIFVGTFVFTVAIDVVPALNVLYHAGELGVSVLPAVFALPTLPFVLLIVMVAGAAFVGAEKVESLFARRRAELALAPRRVPFAKFAVAAGLVAVIGITLGLRPAPRSAATPPIAEIAPLDLAERIIARDPDLLVLDLRAAPDEAPVPGAFRVGLDSTALPVLAGADTATDVVLLADQRPASVPEAWPTHPHYLRVSGGAAAWLADVLTPATPADASVAEEARVRRQNGIAAFFSGAGAAAPAVVAPPPAAAGGGGGAKPKRAGC